MVRAGNGQAECQFAVTVSDKRILTGNVVVVARGESFQQSLSLSYSGSGSGLQTLVVLYH